MQKQTLYGIGRIFSLLCLFTSGANAQQDAQYTQYMYNTVNVNPAYAGSRGVLSAFGVHRSQWVGLKGAPTTNAFAIHTPISNSALGIGLSFVSDRLGPSQENAISMDISYTIPISERYQLAFGIKGTANMLNVDYSKLDIYNPSDPRFQVNIDEFSPNVGAGVYLYSDESYFGVSVPSFLETTHYKDDGNYSTAQQNMHFYVMGGHVFEFTPTLKFKPSVLAKIIQGAPAQIDLSANFLFNEKFTAGVGYRYQGAVSALVGFQVSDGIFVGYAYDAETTKMANYNSGSHEIFLRFELFKSQENVRPPRFF